MYSLKNIVEHDEEIILPKCMYPLKRIYSFDDLTEFFYTEEININIRKQVIKLLKAPNKNMADLEARQDQLLKKLDILYDRIKTISSLCMVNGSQETNESSKNVVNRSLQNKENSKVKAPIDEVLLIFNPDNLPWFLNVFLKKLSINLSWHIHSSVSNEKVPKIKSFIKNLHNTGDSRNTNFNVKLIFRSGSADSELKLYPLALPVLGNVNILRYLSYICPTVAAYDSNDYYMDSLLDSCYLLERTSEKNKETLIKKIFAQQSNWIYKNTFSIVDLAAFNVIKQWRNGAKYVPGDWLEKCQKLCL